MKTSIAIFVLFQILVLQSGCIKKKTVNDFTLDELRGKYTPSVSSQGDVKKSLGIASKSWKPDGAEGEIWEYRNEKGLKRVSFYFDQKSKLIRSVSWYVYSSDPEKDLKIAKAHFGGSKWTSRLADFVSHNIPDECYFQDRENGISIEYRRTRKEVSEIWWWDPRRQIAKDEKCLDEVCRRTKEWHSACDNLQ